MDTYKLYANDTYKQIYAARHGRGGHITGIKRVEPDIEAAKLPTLEYKTAKWEIDWLKRNMMHFRTVEPAR